MKSIFRNRIKLIIIFISFFGVSFAQGDGPHTMLPTPTGLWGVNLKQPS